MKLKSGHFNIFPLLAFVAENPVMPSGRGVAADKFRKVINDLIKDVSRNKQGWYLWGRFNEIGWWETIYLGKAGNKKTSSLATRLFDELREESVAFWALIYGREIASRQHSSLFHGEYDSTLARGLRKMYSQFIIWVELEEKIPKKEAEKAEKEQEAILIKIYRPTHNKNRPKCMESTSLTMEIEEEIEKQIKEIRGIQPKQSKKQIKN